MCSSDLEHPHCASVLDIGVHNARPYVVMDFVSGDNLGSLIEGGPVPLEMTYTAAGHGYINAEVAKHIDEVQIFELNNNLQQAIAGSDQKEVQRVAQEIERKGALMGPRAAKKTMLARQVLTELNAGGRVSKKTMLAVDDAARLAEEAPVAS